MRKTVGSIDEGTVDQVERVADLPLTVEERARITPTLRAWLEAANELSCTMSQPQHGQLAPSIMFVHGEMEEMEP